MSSSPMPDNVVFPAHLFMPPEGIPFDYTAYLATPNIGAGISVISFTVPEGFHGVIKKIGNVYIGPGFVEGSGSLIWQIQQNGGVVRNYDSILASLGTVTAPGEVSGSILVYEQDLIALEVSNVSLGAGSTQVGGRLGGWFFPKDLLDNDIWG